MSFLEVFSDVTREPYDRFKNQWIRVDNIVVKQIEKKTLKNIKLFRSFCTILNFKKKPFLSKKRYMKQPKLIHFIVKSSFLSYKS